MKVKENEYVSQFLQKYPDIYKKVISEIDRFDELISCCERLELKIIRRLDRYIGTSADKVSHNYIIYQIIKKEIAQAFKEKKREHKTLSLSSLGTDDFGESVEYEPRDSYSVNVDSKVIGVDEAMKKVALLVENDFERDTLNAWYQGYSDTEIAKELALRYKKNASSCRKRIQRFRAKCQTKLLVVA